MERQLADNSPTCQRCGSRRGLQPTWESDELSCVNCGARTYVPPRIAPVDATTAAAGFLDEMFQDVLKQLDWRTQERIRRASRSRKRQMWIGLTRGHAVCVPHEPKKRTWTIPEFAWVVDPRPARWARAATDLNSAHRCHAPKAG